MGMGTGRARSAPVLELTGGEAPVEPFSEVDVVLLRLVVGHRHREKVEVRQLAVDGEHRNEAVENRATYMAGCSTHCQRAPRVVREGAERGRGQQRRTDVRLLRDDAGDRVAAVRHLRVDRHVL
eukprot:104455-Prymnesium_polylepis.1